MQETRVKTLGKPGKTNNERFTANAGVKLFERIPDSRLDSKIETEGIKKKFKKRKQILFLPRNVIESFLGFLMCDMFG